MMDTNELDMYLPSEFSEEQLKAMDRSTAVNVVIAELTMIAARPATEAKMNIGLLASAAITKKAGVTKDWLTTMETKMRETEAQKARETAITAAKSNGTLTASDQLWSRKAGVGVRYALPEGVIFGEVDGSLRFVDVTGGPIGPAVYPIEELENGTVRFGGWDRWGRPVRDLSMPFADLWQPKKCQTALSRIGARMEDPVKWCTVVHEIVSQNDLRVSDPEPRETLEEELLRIRAALRQSGRWLRDGVEYAWVSDFERAFGKVSRATRRRWSESGWITRGPDGRLTPLVRRDAAVGRAFAFLLPAEEKPTPAPDAGLAAVDDAARKAVAAGK